MPVVQYGKLFVKYFIWKYIIVIDLKRKYYLGKKGIFRTLIYTSVVEPFNGKSDNCQ